MQQRIVCDSSTHFQLVIVMLSFLKEVDDIFEALTFQG